MGAPLWQAPVTQKVALDASETRLLRIPGEGMAILARCGSSGRDRYRSGRGTSNGEQAWQLEFIP